MVPTRLLYRAKEPMLVGQVMKKIILKNGPQS